MPIIPPPLIRLLVGKEVGGCSNKCRSELTYLDLPRNSPAANTMNVIDSVESMNVKARCLVTTAGLIRERD